MGAINAMKSYQETFGLSGEGSSTGIVFIIYNCGQIAAFPFCGFLADGYGRRICIFVGCALVIVGTAIQTTAHHTGQYIGGRFILGFGASIASAAGPAYTVELAHPSYRGTMAGMYNNCKLHHMSCWGRDSLLRLAIMKFITRTQLTHRQFGGLETLLQDGQHTALI